MNLSCIVGFVIYLTGTMSTARMMILLLLIHMKGIPLDMIQTETILQMAPQLHQKPLKAQKAPLHSSVTILNSTHACEVDRQSY